MLLSVINPSDYRQHRVHERAVVHAMLAVESYGLRVVGRKRVVSMNQRILVAEEPEHALLLVHIVGMGKVLLRDELILLHQRLVNIEFLHSVLSGREELLLARESVAVHGLGNAEGRIGQNAVVAAEHLGIHAAHRCAKDECRLFALAGVAQQLKGLCRVDGQVGSHHASVGQYLAQSVYRARLSA